MKVKNYLLGYKDMYIYQDSKAFNFSLDSVLLPNFVTINKKAKRILDIGCGNAPIPLILSKRTSASIIGVEIQQNICKLAYESVKVNGLENQISIIHSDIREIYKSWESDSFDVITSNPPFFAICGDTKINKYKPKQIARHEISLNIDDILLISKKVLKNEGYLAIVYRPDRIIELLIKMQQNNIEPKKIQFVYSKKDSIASIVLVEGVKNGGKGLKVLPPIYSHNDDGSYSQKIKKYFESR